MLAKNSEPFQDFENWQYERKVDGMRALFHTGYDSTSITSRTGLPLNAQFPELTKLHNYLPAHSIFDGEIVCILPNGQESLEAMQMRMGQTDPEIVEDRMRSYPVSVILFDILQLQSCTLTRQSLAQRRQFLEDLVPDGLGRRVELSQIILPQGEATPYDLAVKHKWEGIVAKKLDSHYEEGKRRASWKKWKITQTQDCIVTGFTEPKGLRERFGSLKLAAYDPRRQLQDIGLCGSGFTEQDIEGLWLMMEDEMGGDDRAGQTTIIEVTYMGWTKTGKLREPRFKQIRFDKNPKDCIIGY